MSTDQQSASYDPRYDGIYQRGGTGSTQQPEVRAIQQLPPKTPPRSLQQTDPYDRSASGHTPAVSASAMPQGSPSYSSFKRQPDGNGPDPSGPSTIREVGAPPEVQTASSPGRNPFDVWVWVIAAVLTALGVYFLTAPIVGAESYAEDMMSQAGSSMYVQPWWQHTQFASLPLILLGVGTAVVQVFVLSIRHTLRTREFRS